MFRRSKLATGGMRYHRLAARGIPYHGTEIPSRRNMAMASTQTPISSETPRKSFKSLVVVVVVVSVDLQASQRVAKSYRTSTLQVRCIGEYVRWLIVETIRNATNTLPTSWKQTHSTSTVIQNPTLGCRPSNRHRGIEPPRRTTSDARPRSNKSFWATYERGVLIRS